MWIVSLTISTFVFSIFYTASKCYTCYMQLKYGSNFAYLNCVMFCWILFTLAFFCLSLFNCMLCYSGVSRVANFLVPNLLETHVHSYRSASWWHIRLVNVRFHSTSLRRLLFSNCNSMAEFPCRSSHGANQMFHAYIEFFLANMYVVIAKYIMWVPTMAPIKSWHKI